LGRTGRWLARAGIIFLIVALLSLIIPALMLLFPPARGAVGQATPLPARTSGVVTEIIDGITVRVEIDGKPFVVRYLGIALPPSNDPWRGWTSAVNERWVGGKTVLLERDVTDADADGRLLRYVWVDDLFVNGALIAIGLGTHVDQFPDLRYSTDLEMYEQNARAEKVGIWETRGARAGLGGLQGSDQEVRRGSHGYEPGELPGRHSIRFFHRNMLSGLVKMS
jgi:endonuclease YncB( thermonuclease family)